MTDNEWGLLVDADGIERGDDILVEREDGAEITMRLKRYTDDFVWLAAGERVTKFSAETLESEDGDGIIKGKA